MAISNPHDAFFKEVFSHKDNVLDLIEGVFPERIRKNLDFSTLDLDTNSYVDEKLKENFSDIVYNCTYRSETTIKITLLFEHKSSVPKYPHLQLLTYLTHIWNTQDKQKEKLTPVVSVILYHGTDKWPEKKFADYFIGIDEMLSFFIPDMQYMLIDLSHLPT